MLKHAEYRRIEHYIKSLGKFKAEKTWQRRVLGLQDGGLTIEQISAMLGVSSRTVKRDLAKSRPSLVYRQRQQLRVVRDRDWSEFLAGL